MTQDVLTEAVRLVSMFFVIGLALGFVAAVAARK